MSDWTPNEAKEFLSIIRGEAEKVVKDFGDRQSSVYACLAVVTDVAESGAITVRLLSSPADGSQDFLVRNRSGSMLEVGDSVWLNYWSDYTNVYIVMRNDGDVPPTILPSDIGAFPNNVVSSNYVINGGFSINQLAKSGTVTLSAGEYGHDMWKAGASGCTYTFTSLENVITLTISSGSLIQIIEGLSLQSGTVCLSWTGTSKGKVGAGSYSTSGVIGVAIGGTNLNIEFNAGTLSNVQLNYGLVALPFVPRNFSDELTRCMRYYEKSYNYGDAPGTSTYNGSIGVKIVYTSNYPTIRVDYKVRKRISPTKIMYSISGASGKITNVTNGGDVNAIFLSGSGENGFSAQVNNSTISAGNDISVHFTADARL